MVTRDLPQIVNQSPRVVSITVAPVDANEAVYTLQVSDPNGWQDIKLMHLVVRSKNVSGDEQIQRCYVKYSPSHHCLWNMYENGATNGYVVYGKSNLQAIKFQISAFKE